MIYYGMEFQSLDSYFQMKEMTAPGTPPANELRIYAKDRSSVSSLYWKNDAGTEFDLAGMTTGTGTANRLTYWTGTTTLGAVGALTNTRVLYANSSGLPADSSTFTWSGTQLLIGGTALASASILEVQGQNGLTLSGFQPFSVLRDTNNSNAIWLLQNSSSVYFWKYHATGTVASATSLMQLAVVSSVGYLGLYSGTSAPLYALDMRGGTNDATQITIKEASGDTVSPGLSLIKARGSIGGESATNSADTLGNIGFGGWTTAYKFNAVRLEAVAGSLWSSSNSEAYFRIQATPSASLNRQEVLRTTAFSTGAVVLIGGGTGVITATNGMEFAPIAGSAINAIIRQNAYGTGNFTNYQGTHARGTAGSPTATQADDVIMRNAVLMYGASQYSASRVAAVDFIAAENATNTANGTYITFNTTPLLSVTVAERLRIGPSGQIGIGGATYGSAGAFMRSAGSAASVAWSTLILPNAATANYIPYATGANTWGESANLQYDGTDFIIGSGTRARMSGQNRFRYLNSMCKVYDSGATQSVNNATATALTFNSEVFDTDTMHDTGSNTSRITAKIAGKYLVMAGVQFAFDVDGVRGFYLYKNGGLMSTCGFDQASATGSIGNIVNGLDIVSLAANDYVEVYAYHEAGAALNVLFAAEYNTHFAMYYLGE